MPAFLTSATTPTTVHHSCPDPLGFTRRPSGLWLPQNVRAIVWFTMTASGAP